MTLRTDIRNSGEAYKSTIKNQWSRLTDEDLERISGSREELIETLMDKYDLSREEAEDELYEFWL